MITKDFRENDNTVKLTLFIQELDKVLLNEKSPYIIVKNTVFVYLEENNILFIALLSEDVLYLFQEEPDSFRV